MQSLIPATQFIKSTRNQEGIPKETPKKKKVSKTSTPTAADNTMEEGSLFSVEASQIPQGNNAEKPPNPTNPEARPEPEKEKTPQRPALRMPSLDVMERVARIYGVTSPVEKETAQKQGPTTAELMKDPFIGVKPGFPTISKGAKVKIPYGFLIASLRKMCRFQRSLGAQLNKEKAEGKRNPKKGRKRCEKVTEVMARHTFSFLGDSAICLNVPIG